MLLAVFLPHVETTIWEYPRVHGNQYEKTSLIYRILVSFKTQYEILANRWLKTN